VEEFPSNSKRPAAKKAAPPAAEKKVEKVVVGEVTQRKKPLGKKMSETFFKGDARGVLEHILTDVLLPSAKDTIVEMGTQFIERLIYGENARSASRRSALARFGTQAGHVAYNRITSNRPTPTGPQQPREDPRAISRQARTHHDFDEILLETRAEADEVVDRLLSLIDQFEMASVADLYDLVGISSSYTDNKWGWTDLRSASVGRIAGGRYLLNLPKPEPLD
jgi:hypothetical protein